MISYGAKECKESRFSHLATQKNCEPSSKGVPFFNTIALRKAKIAYNFGLPECNRVNHGRIRQQKERDGLCLSYTVDL